MTPLVILASFMPPAAIPTFRYYFYILNMDDKKSLVDCVC